MQQCRTRADVAELAGIDQSTPEGQARGASFVHVSINKGYISEQIAGIGEYHYYINSAPEHTKDPDFMKKRARSARDAKAEKITKKVLLSEAQIEEVKEKVREKVEQEVKEMPAPESKVTKPVIRMSSGSIKIKSKRTRRGMTLELSFDEMDQDTICAVLQQMVKSK